MGSLFSGIGGLDLGLEWGIKDAETVWQIEQEPFGRSILAKHWPDADRSVTDVRKGNAENLAPVDLISGGFPCQDISVAGNQKGFDGEKSSLWYEMSRIIGELRPRWIVLENVAAITAPSMRRVLGRVLSDVSALGYSGEWHRVSAAQCGAPHLRNRWFFIGWLPNVANAASIGPGEFGHVDQTQRSTRSNTTQSNRSGANVADAKDPRRERPTTIARLISPEVSRPTRSREQVGGTNHWHVEPPLGRVVNGLSKRLSRRNRHALRALGNAVVPQCAELVGRRVQEIREILDNE